MKEQSYDVVQPNFVQVFFYNFLSSFIIFVMSNCMTALSVYPLPDSGE